MIDRGRVALAAFGCLALAGACASEPEPQGSSRPTPALLQGPPPPATCVIVHRRAAVNYADKADILEKVKGQLAYWEMSVSKTTPEPGERDALYAKADAELEDIIHEWAEADRRAMIAAFLGDCLDQRVAAKAE